MKNNIQPLRLKDVNISGSFWSRYIEQIRTKVIPYQWEALNDNVKDAARSGCIHNFEITAGKKKGEFYGMAFQDSDLYKWLESVAYSLATKPDSEMEKLADHAIDLIAGAQTEDGYINTYYTIKEKNARWNNLQFGHELYCAGHLIEAAVEYHNATGKRKILDVAIKFADCIDKVFGLEKGQINGYPGHQEIELALFKLYQVTNEKRYLNLAAYFIKERGKTPNYFDQEQEKPEYIELFPELNVNGRDYSQSHKPPVEQKVATGHAVRAVYMYSAMADLATELNDTALKEACNTLYTDIVTKQMYITGAIGSASFGERFTSSYDLPNDLVYGETCASVGLMMFCRRMNILHGSAEYADTMETALYNTVLAGISLAGTEFYYVNPLEVNPQIIPENPTFKHIKPTRQKWFDCACCPSNLARTVMGLGLYAYGKTETALYINLFCEGRAKDGERTLDIKTQYPFNDTATITAKGGNYTLHIRNPKAAPIQSIKLNGNLVELVTENGYISLSRIWQSDVIEIKFDLTPKFIYSAGELQYNAGKAAVVRGPIVYCAEEADNGKLLASYVINDGTQPTTTPMPEGLLPELSALNINAHKYNHSTVGLYTTEKPTLAPAPLKLIPYFLWANRGENEMRVYLNTKN